VFSIRTLRGSAFAAAVILLTSCHALGDEEESRKDCELVFALSMPLLFSVSTN